MSTEVGDFFLVNNSVENIAEEEYRKVEYLVDAAKAFARSTYRCVYIIDYFKRSFVYVSDNLAALCGEPAAKIQDFGYNLYIDHVPQSELEMLKEINKKGFDLFSTFPVSERTDYSIRYDFHLMNGRKSRLIHHTLTPLTLDREGKIWLALCTISLSSRNTPGHIVIRKEGSRTFYQYNLQSHRWEEQVAIVLSETEREVLVLSTQGYTMADIADIMCKSVDTIKACKRNLFAKLGVKNIAEALYHAVNYRLI